MKKFIKKIVGFRDDLTLPTKWWHRLFKIVFLFTILVTFCLATFASAELIPDNTTNNTVVTNLRDYTATSTAGNTIPEFLEIEGLLGCVDDDEFRYLSAHSLSSENICNADLVGNIDEVAEALHSMVGFMNTPIYDLKNALQTKFSNEQPGGNCLIQKDFGCDPGQIVKHRRNPIFYLEVVGLGLGITFFVGLSLLVIYYRGLIYIIFGGPKPNGF